MQFLLTFYNFYQPLVNELHLSDNNKQTLETCIGYTRLIFKMSQNYYLQYFSSNHMCGVWMPVHGLPQLKRKEDWKYFKWVLPRDDENLMVIRKTIKLGSYSKAIRNYGDRFNQEEKKWLDINAWQFIKNYHRRISLRAEIQEVGHV